ncbi:MAG: trimethylamine methyltransferase family protein [Candidatus Bathyarchaeota archaeon]|nr:MAG: trimethylamine methyltransferase family protein [Candidatus Bathyarchaeota archaeon]
MEVKSGQLRVLTSDEVYEIHLAALEILGHVGVRVLEPNAFSVLKEAGADVNQKERIARIPQNLVDEAVKKAPSSFTLYGRNGNYKLRLGDKRTYFALPGTGVNVLDLETGKCRSSTLADLRKFYRLADALPNVHHASLAVEPTDISDPVASLYSVLEGFRNTTKTIDGDSYGENGSLDTIKMASVVAGGTDELKKKPRLLGYVNPVSPLQQSKEMMEGLLVYAEYSQPVIIAPEAQAGATAPVTLAGLLAQQNAEILSGVVITQLVNPGSPVLYGAVSTIMDMREGNVALGSVETGLINVAAAQLARFYNLPSRGTGGTTEAKVPDLQAGYEKAITLMMTSLAGINFIYDAAGSLESTLTASFEQVVADNELCGMVARAARGIDVREETLATDIIEAVGPGGQYLTQKHTLEHLRKEHYLPSILSRQNRLKWEKSGSKTLRDVAHEETKRILKEHEPEPLETEVDKELEKTIKELEKERMRFSKA